MSAVVLTIGEVLVRILLAAFCLIAIPFTWLAMNMNELCVPPDGSVADRVLVALQRSVSNEWPITATVICTLSALSQYGFRHSVRRIIEIEQGKPDPPGGFRWVRALQSVVIAWALWYATLIAHCLK